MYNKLVSCIDVNSPFCPCLLAETNHCIYCSQLKGNMVCDCNWAGVCVLYEKYWNKGKSEDIMADKPTRIEIEADVIIKRKYTESVYLLEFEVNDELAATLHKPGSFVFMRRACDASCYDFPVGVMNVINHSLQVVVEAIGPKSTKILRAKDKKILIRGPYYNGILGHPWIDKLNCGKIILLAGGMGQAPALPIIKKLVGAQNDVTIIIAPGKIGTFLLEDELNALQIKTIRVSSMRREGMQFLQGILSSSNEILPDLIISAGSDEQHYGIIAAMKMMGLDIPMAVTNNANMCCGEGICGSCLKENINHQTVRMCKSQIDFKKLLSYK